ncbi:MAG: permease-like cell division protein FtsX [Parcubacteria group bacterium]|jgi:cell division transport system permease protein
MFLVIGRTFKEALSNFFRNGWLSLAAVTVLILSLYILSLMFVVTKTANGILTDVENKVNVSVYFKSDATPERMEALQNQLEKNADVASVDFVSREKALENFKRNNANEPIIIKSLEEIGDNPLLASLIVKANNQTKYDSIVSAISGSDYKDDISRVNYGKNKEIIDRLNKIITEIKKFGLGLVVLFSVISILIVFNTIRITIYTHKNEIEVMRLVGASNTFIRLPFVFEGILYGIIATLISTVFVFVTIFLVNSKISTILTSQNLLSVFYHNVLFIIGVQLAVGIILGVVSSMIAIRKYLKI